jgi:hypothetical protein
MSLPVTPLKKIAARLIVNAREWNSARRTKRWFVSARPHFSFGEVRQRTLGFIQSMHCPQVHPAAYRYSATAKKCTLYSSAYAAMTFSILRHLPTLPGSVQDAWTTYFNDHQNPSDGLFYDPAIHSAHFPDSDWWGARHLAVHMTTAYTALGRRPKHPFLFLRDYYCQRQLTRWLEGVDWRAPIPHEFDIDNKILNITSLLQYQRDHWHDERAARSVTLIQEHLASRINPETGMWGKYDVKNPHERSRMVQFAYHLFPIFFYDSIPTPYADKVIPQVLATQNELGGFGVRANSSACEDIDSIDLLIRFVPHSPGMKGEVDAALAKTLPWVASNQMPDGGFVFRQYEPFTYGDAHMHSEANSGAMFPTWFRLLSIAYILRHMGNGEPHLLRSPGLEF